jgi:peptidoglycan-associated lipoprotein
LLQGVDDNNISVVSFGEELPMDLGHDDSAWQQNRRVELVYED